MQLSLRWPGRGRMIPPWKTWSRRSIDGGGARLPRMDHIGYRMGWTLRTARNDPARHGYVHPPAAAAEFDRLRENKKLKKIGRADLLVAAITLANRATLVSRNLKDFSSVLIWR